MKRRSDMTFWERLYLVEAAKGVLLTSAKLLRNLIYHPLKLIGFCGDRDGVVSIQYPDERRRYPSRYRGRHRLTLNPDGTVRCTACFLCATACPARCIYIEAAEHPDPRAEKFPHRYEIETLLCIYCGYCVEACPVDAIRMDTGLHPEIYPPDPRMYIEDKELLMTRSRELADLGPDFLFSEHMRKVRDLERRPGADPLAFTPGSKAEGQ